MKKNINYFVRSKMVARFKLINILLILLILGGGIFCRVYAAIQPAERAALIALYNSTNGDNWTNHDGWKDGLLHTDGFAMPGTENNWYGIICDGGNTTVTNINIVVNNLNGSIPADLGNLTNLLYLYLYNNQLTGSIPAELGNLTNLERLYLYVNQLSGAIPADLGNLTNLKHLYLSDNQLTGSIPADLGNLTNLERLYLYGNQLSGSIPVDLGNLTNLIYLYLSGNQLTGSIPADLGNLTNLERLYLYGNQLSGSIPASLTSLNSLTSIIIRYNALYTNDDILRTFLDSLDSKTPGWEDTQTIAPKDININSCSQSSIEVSWAPINYTGNSGGYRVLYSTTSRGPYTFFDTTDDKLVTQMEVTGLDADTTYYLVVQTRTDPHVDNQNTIYANNQNTVYSEYSEEVPATTLPLPVIPTESEKSNTPTESENDTPILRSDGDDNGGGCFIENISSASNR